MLECLSKPWRLAGRADKPCLQHDHVAKSAQAHCQTEQGSDRQLTGRELVGTISRAASGMRS